MVAEILLCKFSQVPFNCSSTPQTPRVFARSEGVTSPSGPNIWGDLLSPHSLPRSPYPSSAPARPKASLFPPHDRSTPLSLFRMPFTPWESHHPCDVYCNPHIQSGHSWALPHYNEYDKLKWTQGCKSQCHLTLAIQHQIPPTGWGSVSHHFWCQSPRPRLF